MQRAKGIVLLVRYPKLVVEVNHNDILYKSLLRFFVLNHYLLLNVYLQGDLEKLRTTRNRVVSTSHHMVYEHFSWVENVTELALNAACMLKCLVCILTVYH
jgi:hypothetical protein